MAVTKCATRYPLPVARYPLPAKAKPFVLLRAAGGGQRVAPLEMWKLFLDNS